MIVTTSVWGTSWVLGSPPWTKNWAFIWHVGPRPRGTPSGVPWSLLTLLGVTVWISVLATRVCVWCFSGLSSPHPAEIDQESSGHQASTCPSCTPPAADIAKSRLVCIVIDGRSVSPFSRHHSTQYSPSSPSLFSGAVNSSFGRRGRAAVRCVALQRVSPFSHTPDCRLSDCAGRLSWLTLLRKRTLKSA